MKHLIRKNSIIRTVAMGYHSPEIKLLKEMGFTEEGQRSTDAEAMKYATMLLPYNPKVVIVYFDDGHYGIWTEG